MNTSHEPLNHPETLHSCRSVLSTPEPAEIEIRELRALQSQSETLQRKNQNFERCARIFETGLDEVSKAMQAQNAQELIALFSPSFQLHESTIWSDFLSLVCEHNSRGQLTQLGLAAAKFFWEKASSPEHGALVLRFELLGRLASKGTANGALFETPNNHPLAQYLLQRAEKECNDQVLRELVETLATCNAKHLNPATLQQPLHFKPAGVDWNKWNSTTPSLRQGEIRAFALALTKGDLLMGYIKELASLPLPLQKVQDLLASIAPQNSDPALSRYASFQRITLKPQAAKEALFVDVDGTLITLGQWKDEPDHLNQQVLTQMRRFRSKGVPVIVFTGGVAETKTKQLQQLGLPEEFLPVQEKRHHEGRPLKWLIDDEYPEGRLIAECAAEMVADQVFLFPEDKDRLRTLRHSSVVS